MLGDGQPPHEMSLDEFITQAEAYRETGDVADSVFKILNLLGATHPFFVLRLAEIRTWIEEGAYDRILRGEYQRRGEPDPKVREDIAAAAQAYKEGAKGVVDQMTDVIALDQLTAIACQFDDVQGFLRGDDGAECITASHHRDGALQ